jgi:hypothetical protein
MQLGTGVSDYRHLFFYFVRGINVSWTGSIIKERDMLGLA